MKPNIIFLVIDSLRSDKFYGAKKTSKTPNIDKLIQNGVFFPKTVSGIPSTKRATASMLTSLYPFKTSSTDDNFFKLDSKLTTHLHSMKKNGFHIYATIPEIFSTTNIFSDVENNDMYYNTFTGRLQNSLGDEIISFLESKKFEEPWIYYVHLLDLIRPVISNGKFDSQEYGVDQYERIISCIDEWIGKILQKIDLEKTIIVITADHANYLPHLEIDGKTFSFEPSNTYRTIWKLGLITPKSLQPLWLKLHNAYKVFVNKKIKNKIDIEKLSSHQKRILLNIIGHTRDVHDDSLLIPFLASGYNLQKFYSNFLTRQIDIFPTLFEFIDLKISTDIDGCSVYPLIQGKKMDPLYCYIENLPANGNDWKKIVGIKFNDYKFMKEKSSDSQIQLYNLKNDPFEEQNFAADEPEMTYKMNEYLKNILENSTSDSNSSLSEHERKKVENELKKLGYI
ncbi:sulfatase family protein [Nitrosopumilus sp. S6]